MTQGPGRIIGYTEYGEPIYAPPPQSNTSMVVGLVTAGVLLVLVLTLGGVLLFTRGPLGPGRGAPSAAPTQVPPDPATTTNAPVPSSADATAPGETPGSSGAPSSMPRPSSTTYSAPATTPDRGYTIAGADGQGFLSYGPRCNYTNPAVVIGRTTRSELVICKTGVGRFYYKGMRLSDGAPLEIADPSPSGSGYTARNGATDYSVTRSALTITQQGSLVVSEPMIDYWSN